MSKTTTPRAFLVAGALLTATLASLLLPAAAAHTCYSDDPANACGPCGDGTHAHYYFDGGPYCLSYDPSVCRIVCDYQVQDPWSLVGRLLG